jgi:hypothetical protein
MFHDLVIRISLSFRVNWWFTCADHTLATVGNMWWFRQIMSSGDRGRLLQSQRKNEQSDRTAEWKPRRVTARQNWRRWQPWVRIYNSEMPRSRRSSGGGRSTWMPLSRVQSPKTVYWSNERVTIGYNISKTRANSTWFKNRLSNRHIVDVQVISS